MNDLNESNAPVLSDNEHELSMPIGAEDFAAQADPSLGASLGGPDAPRVASWWGRGGEVRRPSRRRDGETGKHRGLKIPRASRPCGFNSRSRHSWSRLAELSETIA